MAAKFICQRRRRLLGALGAVPLALALLAGSAPTALAQRAADDAPAGGPVRLSSFGERPNFSPDGGSLVFVGEAYGDAYEVDLATHEVRNITRDVPHQGVVRIQYLANGDFLVTAPQRYRDANTRAHLEMWVLDKDLKTGLQPLGEKPLEGIAVSRSSNLVAWTALAPGVTMDLDEPWPAMFGKPTTRYVAEVEYRDGVAHFANKREIMSTLPGECLFTEPQDFRDSDGELIFSCLGSGAQVSIMGYNLSTEEYTTYRRVEGEYTEIEGVAPDGSWGTVECGSLSDLSICRLELEANGEMRTIISPDETLPAISNPVVHPDGDHIALQTNDGGGEIGEGMGIYLLGISPDAEQLEVPTTEGRGTAAAGGDETLGASATGEPSESSADTWLAIVAAAIATAALVVALLVRSRVARHLER